jgi:hypothetical protein
VNPFEFALGVVLIVTLGRIIRDVMLGSTRRERRQQRRSVRIDGRQGLITVGDDDTSREEAERLRGEVARLNERIQVLERLATDPAKRLSDEIESLARK